MPPYLSIFLDAAGTLIKTRESVGTVYARVAANFGVRIAPDTVQRHFVETFRQTAPPHHPDGPAPDDERSWWHGLVSTVFSKSGVGHVDIEPCFDALYAYYATADAWELFPDALPFLHQCRTHYPDTKLGVLSNFDKRLRSVLDQLEITRYFHSITISSEGGVSKPHAMIFQRALSAHDCAPENALHIGDSPEADWAGAEKAGLHFFKLIRPENSLLDAIPFA